MELCAGSGPGEASLDLKRFKAADRVTILLNYLYLVLFNNKLIFSCQESLARVSDIFKSLLAEYTKILSRWLNLGELKDPYDEFFITLSQPDYQTFSRQEPTLDGQKSESQKNPR